MFALPLTFHAVAEDLPGDQFAQRFAATWPAYRTWFLQAGDAARPSFVESRAALREHVPELVPTWERLVELAGGGDTAARMLALWCPPAHLAGCTQAVLRGRAPVLVRNYDYDPSRFDALILHSAYGDRRVIGTTDCLWGLLDGMNEDGLAVSITFGGTDRTGPGFGIALIVRYLLETCSTTAEAMGVLDRVPVHMAYNVTALDASGASETAFVGPHRRPAHVAPAVVTNHQEEQVTESFAKVSHSRDREAGVRVVLDSDEETAIRAFLAPPVYNASFGRSFGTLYTAVYRVEEGCVDYRWPSSLWRQSFDAFTPGEHTVPLIQP
jgi:predicted choloylglycine hydrolase